MMPKVASAVTSGERPLIVGGSEGTRPLASSLPAIAQTGSTWSIASARSVTTVNVPTSASDTSSIRR